jgi:hypothetical protein
VNPLERITERVGRLGHPDAPDTPTPLLSIEEFFEGNDEVGSIGCNIFPTPTPQDFYEIFRRTASRNDVADIRVQVTAFDAPEWPFTDTVYVMTTAPAEEVMHWFPESMRPDETRRGFFDQAYEPYDVPPGVWPIACWWD